MPDFFQNGLITTLHDLGSPSEDIEDMLRVFTKTRPIGLILPVTASDMRAPPFARIMEQLADADYIRQVVVVLNVAPREDDYHEAAAKLVPLGSRGRILWTDGQRVQKLYEELMRAGIRLGTPGKGRTVWSAFGYLIADPQISIFALHDCDIVNYDRSIPARLCLPLVHTALDFEFCKAYYARFTDRMHGRVVRLLMSPMLRAMISMVGNDRFLLYLDSFRYPLSGEFAVNVNLARSNRIPSDWGLEIGTLAEVFRNTSIKRVCQVDLCPQYEHKHQDLSYDDPSKGLMKMATDIMTSIFRTLASMGTVLQSGHFLTLRSAYLRNAQDAVRQYHADAVMNGLTYDRHEEERAVEGFARQITAAGEIFQQDPLGGESIPNWARVMAARPDLPQRLWDAAIEDAKEFGGGVVPKTHTGNSKHPKRPAPTAIAKTKRK
jgi:glucosyl-3-phosphoglycerate synthase